MVQIDPRPRPEACDPVPVTFAIGDDPALLASVRLGLCSLQPSAKQRSRAPNEDAVSAERCTGNRSQPKRINIKRM